MKPTVGRIVHYMSAGSPVQEDGTQTYPSICRAAIVTFDGFWDSLGEIDLCIFNPEGVHFRKGVLQDEEKKHTMTWHWPERDPEDNKWLNDSLKAVSRVIKIPGVVEAVQESIDGS